MTSRMVPFSLELMSWKRQRRRASMNTGYMVYTAILESFLFSKHFLAYHSRNIIVLCVYNVYWSERADDDDDDGGMSHKNTIFHFKKENKVKGKREEVDIWHDLHETLWKFSCDCDDDHACTQKNFLVFSQQSNTYDNDDEKEEQDDDNVSSNERKSRGKFSLYIFFYWNASMFWYFRYYDAKDGNGRVKWESKTVVNDATPWRATWRPSRAPFSI